MRMPKPLAEDMFSLSFEPSLAEVVPELTAGQSDQLLSMLRPVRSTPLGQMQDTVLIVFQGSTLRARRYRMEARASAPPKAAAVASVAVVSAGQTARSNLAVASPNAAASSAANLNVIDAVKRWAQAWSQRDVATYGAAYESDFRGAGGLLPAASNAAWLRQRRETILSKQRIEVELEDLQVGMLPPFSDDTAQAQVRFDEARWPQVCGLPVSGDGEEALQKAQLQPPGASAAVSSGALSANASSATGFGAASTELVAAGRERVDELTDEARVREQAAAVAVDVARSRVSVFPNGCQGLSLKREYGASIGKNGMVKQVAGHQRTPLGVYFVTAQIRLEWVKPAKLTNWHTAFWGQFAKGQAVNQQPAVEARDGFHSTSVNLTQQPAGWRIFYERVLG